jgi:hypothetical protein
MTLTAKNAVLCLFLLLIVVGVVGLYYAARPGPQSPAAAPAPPQSPAAAPVPPQPGSLQRALDGPDPRTYNGQDVVGGHGRLDYVNERCDRLPAATLSVCVGDAERAWNAAHPRPQFVRNPDGTLRNAGY